MQKIYANFDKKSIEKLPIELFQGRIFTVSTVSETNKAVKYLRRFPMLGIDTETRPNFSRETSYKVSLLQVSTQDTCFLFRLNATGIPDSLAGLLANKKQLKIGLSIKDDIHALNARRNIDFGRHIELQELVRAVGIFDMSLQKIYANLFGKKISKNKRLSNWEAPILTDGQKHYAATDAWACIQIYRRLEQLRTDPDYEYIAPMDDRRMFNIWIDTLLRQIQHHHHV